MKWFSLCWLAGCYASACIAANQIPTVTVTPSAQPISRINLSNNKRLISRETIRKSGATSIAGVLRGEAGIQLRDLYGDGGHIVLSLRGFGDNAGSNTLILVDGIPLNNPDLSLPNFNTIPLHDVDHIEIIEGSAGTLLGDQAVGGMVNIVLRHPTKQEFHSSVSLGSYADHRYRVSYADRFNTDLSYRISANYRNTNNYRKHNAHQDRNLLTTVHYTHPQDQVDFSYQRNDSDLEYAGALTISQVHANRRQALNTTDFNDQINHHVHLSWHHQFHPDWHFTVDTAYRCMTGEGFLGGNFTESRRVTRFNPRLKGILYWHEAPSFLTVGLKAQHARYDLQGTSFFSKDEQALYATYVHYVFPLWHGIETTIGSRYAMQRDQLHTESLTNRTDHAHAWIGEFGLAKQFNHCWRGYLRADGNFRFPKADENALTDDNRPLKTQTGISYEAGLAYERHTFSSKLAIYQLDLDDEILFLPSTDSLTFGVNTNLDPTRRRGLIFSAQEHWTPQFHSTLDYAFVKGEFDSGINHGKCIPFVARQTLRLSSDYTWRSHWHLYGEGLFLGSRFAAGDNTNAGRRLGGYTIFNVALQYEFDHFTLTGRVNNVSDKRYYAYSLVSSGGGVTTFYYPAPTRNFLVTLAYQL